MGQMNITLVTAIFVTMQLCRWLSRRDCVPPLGVTDSRFTVYRRAKVPAARDFNQNPREGDPVIVPTGPYIFTAPTPQLRSPRPGRRP